MGQAEDQFPRDVALGSITYNGLQYDYQANYGHIGPVNYVCMKLTQAMKMLSDQEKLHQETVDALNLRLEELRQKLREQQEPAEALETSRETSRQFYQRLEEAQQKLREQEETSEAFQQRLEEMHLELNRERELHKQRQQYAAETHERELSEMKQRLIETSEKASDLELRLSAINRARRLGDGMEHMAEFLRNIADVCEESRNYLYE